MAVETLERLENLILKLFVDSNAVVPAEKIHSVFWSVAEM